MAGVKLCALAGLLLSAPAANIGHSAEQAHPANIGRSGGQGYTTKLSAALNTPGHLKIEEGFSLEDVPLFEDAGHLSCAVWIVSDAALTAGRSGEPVAGLGLDWGGAAAVRELHELSYIDLDEFDGILAALRHIELFGAQELDVDFAWDELSSHGGRMYQYVTRGGVIIKAHLADNRPRYWITLPNGSRGWSLEPGAVGTLMANLEAAKHVVAQWAAQPD